MALIQSKQLNPKFTGSFIISGSKPTDGSFRTNFELLSKKGRKFFSKILFMGEYSFLRKNFFLLSVPYLILKTNEIPINNQTSNNNPFNECCPSRKKWMHFYKIHPPFPK